MTDGGSSESRLTKNQRRQAAREKARQLREEQRKREKRNRMLIQGGIVVGVLAVLAIIAVVIVSSIRPAGPGPKNMASDGVVIGEGLKVETTPALKPGEEPTPTAYDTSDSTAHIVMYIDYLCPFCGQFEKTNGDQIQSWVDSGAATVEVHPIPLLQANSQGTKYSLRAANAVACVANYSPDDFWSLHALLMANQPQEGSAGLDDDTLKELVGEATDDNVSKINACIDGGDYDDWAQDALSRFLDRDFPDADNVGEKLGTPLVMVNGQQFTGSLDDADVFRSFVQKASSASYSENSGDDADDETSDDDSEKSEEKSGDDAEDEKSSDDSDESSDEDADSTSDDE